MRKTSLLLAFFIFEIPLLFTQSVDSIRLEQSGDLIKVHYRILDSKPTQIFRVSVLCSINGGLKSQLNALSGDYGENVTGGRDEYLILWDVLKDVEELNSAEFFIKAELLRDLSGKVDDNSPGSKVKGKFLLFAGLEAPGPKGALRAGYMGNYGVSVGLNYGSIPILKEYKDNVYYNGFSPAPGIGIDLTRRIINNENFQLHLLGGFRNTDLIVYASTQTPPQFWDHGMGGIETGIVFAVQKLAACITVSHFFPGQADAQHEVPVVMASPVNLFDFNLGIKF